jgi:hypothetical protein
VADAIEGGEEICDRLEADAALAKFCAGQDLGLQFVMFAEEEVRRRRFCGRDGPGIPSRWAWRRAGASAALRCGREENRGQRIMRADRLSAGASAAAVEPGGKDASVVEDDQIAGTQ